eukprot:jgi/Tetstr1/427379/TSEL_017543.t1
MLAEGDVGLDRDPRSCAKGAVELRRLRRARRLRTDVMARTAVQAVVVARVLAFALKCAAALRAKLHMRPKTFMTLSLCGTSPLRDALSALVPLLRRPAGKIVLDAAGHMAGPSCLLCLVVPLGAAKAKHSVEAQLRRRLLPKPLQEAKSPYEALVAVHTELEARRKALKGEVHKVAGRILADVQSNATRDLGVVQSALEELRRRGEGSLASIWGMWDEQAEELAEATAEDAIVRRLPVHSFALAPPCSFPLASTAPDPQGPLWSSRSLPSPGEYLFGAAVPHR